MCLICNYYNCQVDIFGWAKEKNPSPPRTGPSMLCLTRCMKTTHKNLYSFLLHVHQIIIIHLNLKYKTKVGSLSLSVYTTKPLKLMQNVTVRQIFNLLKPSLFFQREHPNESQTGLRICNHVFVILHTCLLLDSLLFSKCIPSVDHNGVT